MKWKSLVEPPLSDDLLKKLSHISRTLIAHSQNPTDEIGLMNGKAGMALFFFYYARLTGEEKYADHASELFSSIFQQINEGFNDFRFSDGLAGIGWVLVHLVRNNFIEFDIDELLDSLDPFFYKSMTTQFQQKDYDFLHGGLGVGTYWLSRFPRTNTREYLSDCIGSLDLMWGSILNPGSESKKVNLGVAHGIPSIIAFLSKVLEPVVSANKTRDLLERVVSYLLAQTQEPAQFGSFFPHSVGMDSGPSSSRLAWCYGDLGIGSVLWQTSRVTGNKEWEEQAIQILIHSTTRKALPQNLVMDACFCHGTAGIAHIYNRMYHYTGREAFKEAAHYWLEQTLNMAVYTDGAAGFKIWCGEDIWQNRYCLLDGIAGIGMALMAAVSDIEPSWDRCFLLS